MKNQNPQSPNGIESNEITSVDTNYVNDLFTETERQKKGVDLELNRSLIESFDRSYIETKEVKNKPKNIANKEKINDF